MPKVKFTGRATLGRIHAFYERNGGAGCSRCGYCCQYPPELLKSDINRISFYLQMSDADFIREYCVGGSIPTLRGFPRDIGGRKAVVCPFLRLRRKRGAPMEAAPGKTGYEATCRIHAAKPFLCRAQLCFNNSTVTSGFRKALMREFERSWKDKCTGVYL